MITDPQKVRAKGDPGRPEICNVFSYEKLFGTPAERVEEIDRTCRSGELGCRSTRTSSPSGSSSTCGRSASGAKQALADRGELERMLARGAERAREIAVPIHGERSEAMGL